MAAKPTDRICSIDGCERKHFGRGWCRLHYNRMSRYGRPDRLRHSQPDGKCSVEGCERDHHASGYCGTHLMRLRRDGDVGTAELQSWKRRSKYRNVACSIEGCDRPAKARGWCEMHYQRWHYSGDAEGRWGPEPRKSEGHWGTDGYFRVRVGNKIRLQHHLVMEEMIGRSLDSHENVHHRNGQRGDNRPENLELWMRPQPNGVRVDDMVAFIVDHYREEVLKRLSEGDDGSGAVLA